MSPLSPPNNVQAYSNKIVNSVHDSCHKFSITETPYSLYITVRKSFKKDAIPYPQVQNLQYHDEQAANRNLLHELETLRVHYQESSSDCQELKCEVDKLETDIEVEKDKNSAAMKEASKQLETKGKIIEKLTEDKKKPCK